MHGATMKFLEEYVTFHNKGKPMYAPVHAQSLLTSKEYSDKMNRKDPSFSQDVKTLSETRRST